MGDFAANKDVSMLTGDPKKAIRHLSGPIAVALLLQQGNSMVDTLWVTGLGSSAMAALGVVSPFYSVIIGIGSGMAIGASAAIARNIGMKRKANADKVAAQSLLLIAVLSLIMTPLMMLTARPLLMMAGSPLTIEASMDYAMPLYFSSFALMMSCMVPGLLRGEGAAKKSMYTQIAMAVTNIILDPIMIYTLDMGVAGAAWATVIACIVASAMGLYWYIRGRTFVSLRFSAMRKFDRTCMKDILSVGLPQSLEFSAMYLFNVIYNLCILMVSTPGVLAAYTVVWRIINMVTIPVQAMGGAVVSACSAEYGMKRYDMISKAFSFSVRASLICTSVLTAAVIILADPIASVFTYAPDMQMHHGEMVTITRILMLCVPVFSLIYVGSSLLQAVNRSKVSMWSSILRNILITIAFVTAAFLIGTTVSLWVALSSVEVFGGLLMWYLARMVLKNLSRKDKPELRGLD